MIRIFHVLLVLSIIGGLIGLIIYLTRKKKHPTTKPPGPGPATTGPATTEPPTTCSPACLGDSGEGSCADCAAPNNCNLCAGGLEEGLSCACYNLTKKECKNGLEPGQPGVWCPFPGINGGKCVSSVAPSGATGAPYCDYPELKCQNNTCCKIVDTACQENTDCCSQNCKMDNSVSGEGACAPASTCSPTERKKRLFVLCTWWKMYCMSECQRK